jgi:indolepyruvate ferredoxin oxidoreductase, alpha subunit
MERSFAAEVKQLALGDGQILRGEGILAITKALLQSGVSYVGGYPGAPVSHLLDVLGDANEPLLEPMGVYLDASANEAAAAALLGASINYPMRGAVTWKSIVGTNVAADALSNLASAGVIGGALIVVGEDYGAGASVIQERTHAFALKSSLCLIDPKPTLQNLARMVEEGFGMSEASNLPAVISLRIRAAHLRGTMVCKDNVRPRVSMRDRLERPSFDYARLSHPPSTYAQEAQKFEQRLPNAVRFVVERRLNEVVPGDDKRIGIILQGGLTPTVLRALALAGHADVYGGSRIPLLILNVIHPLVPDQLLGFLEGKERVLVIEEGMPNFIEQELKALAYDRGLSTKIHGKNVVAAPGEYVPEVVLAALARFLGGDAERRRVALLGHMGRGKELLATPLPKRPPAFCTGCPERPVFSALKIAQRELGETHVAADIGCHAFATLPPFNMGNTILGYGMGLASSGAVAPAFGKRVVSIMGDGGFWHSGLTAGVANAVYNEQDSVLVILENFYTSATGQQSNPSSGKNPRGHEVKMSIAETIKSLGVSWVKVVNPYKVGDTLRTVKDAMTTAAGGLKVIIARAECQLERQRRVKPQVAARLKAGARVEVPRFGVDPDVCTGDKSCMRFNGCPSLTLGENPDPLRDDPVARVDQSCVGCGLCGEVAHAAVLCPSFYEVRVVHHASAWERVLDGIRRRVIGWFQAA